MKYYRQPDLRFCPPVNLLLANFYFSVTPAFFKKLSPISYVHPSPDSHDAQFLNFQSTSCHRQICICLHVFMRLMFLSLLDYKCHGGYRTKVNDLMSQDSKWEGHQILSMSHFSSLAIDASRVSWRHQVESL